MFQAVTSVSQKPSNSMMSLLLGGTPLFFGDKVQAVVLIQLINAFFDTARNFFKSEFCILVTKILHNIFKIVHAHLLTSMNHFNSCKKKKSAL